MLIIVIVIGTIARIAHAIFLFLVVVLFFLFLFFLFAEGDSGLKDEVFELEFEGGNSVSRYNRRSLVDSLDSALEVEEGLRVGEVLGTGWEARAEGGSASLGNAW